VAQLTVTNGVSGPIDNASVAGQVLSDALASKVEASNGTASGLSISQGSLDPTSNIGGHLVSKVLSYVGVDGWQPWTPQLLIGAQNAGMIASAPTAGYTTRANLLWFWCSVRLIYKGSGTGSVTIAGLPSPSVGNFSFPLTILSTGAVADGSSVSASVSNGLITLFKSGASGDPSSVLTDADVENAATFEISGWYPIEGPLN